MSAVLQEFPRAIPRTAVAERADPFRQLPEWAQEEAQRCLTVIRPALARMQQGVSRHAAAQWLSSMALDAPSWKTLDRWLEQYLAGGLAALAPRNKGRLRREQGWEARALALYNQPQKPAYATVAYWLREEGFEAQEHAVRRYLKSLPSNLSETSPKRLGGHHYNQNIKPHIVRDNTTVPVGFIYEGDGHCCDVYVAHPNTGRPFRPELTVWLDIRSRKLVAWWISESESAQSTLFSLSQALVAHDHTPAFIHSDPGSGFTARMISDEVTGFCSRFSIQAITALPGNARGKGLTEGWFRWFEERLGKRFATFCGHDRSDDFLRHLSKKVERGEIVLPTLQEYISEIARYVAGYNSNTQDALGAAPDAIWQQLQRVPLETPAAAVVRPRERRTVQRWSVRIDNRTYRSQQIAAYEGREVIVEYSIHDDERVSIHDDTGRFVCEAGLVKKAAWLPASRVDEAQQKRLQGQHRRHQLAMDEQSARASSPLPLRAEENVLEQGHSVAPPARLPRTPAAPAALDDRTTQILSELEQRPAAPRSTRIKPANPEHEIAARFERAQQIQQQLDSGAGATDTDTAWLQRYQTTAEYRGQARFLNSFSTAG